MADFKREMTRAIPQLRRYARALVNQVDVADDLVQDCLERALAKKKQWDERRAMRPWLFAILHSIYANDARRYKRTPAMVPYSGMETAPTAPDNIDLMLTDLQRALDMLPDDYREILLLVGLEQMSYKETAVVLNLPIGTVMSRLTRARKKLRLLMTDPTLPTVPQIRRVK